MRKTRLNIARYDKWRESQNTTVCVGIICLFAKLENSARFLSDVVDNVVALEASMSRFVRSIEHTIAVLGS